MWQNNASLPIAADVTHPDRLLEEDEEVEEEVDDDATLLTLQWGYAQRVMSFAT